MVWCFIFKTRLLAPAFHANALFTILKSLTGWWYICMWVREREREREIGRRGGRASVSERRPINEKHVLVTCKQWDWNSRTARPVSLSVCLPVCLPAYPCNRTQCTATTAHSWTGGVNATLLAGAKHFLFAQTLLCDKECALSLSLSLSLPLPLPLSLPPSLSVSLSPSISLPPSLSLPFSLSLFLLPCPRAQEAIVLCSDWKQSECMA